MVRILLLLGLAFAPTLGDLTAAAQAVSQTSVPTGVIVGVVVDRGAGKPIPDAIVTITSTSAPANSLTGPLPQRVMTDPAGRFAFAGLPAGPVLISATKAGYAGADTRLAVDTAGGQALIDLRAGERITNAELSLTKLSSISGRVIDDLGDPVVGVSVRAHRRAYEGGYSRLSHVGGAQTDDRGIYRMASLAPGDYVVTVPAMPVSVPVSAKDFAAYDPGTFIDLMGRVAISTVYGTQKIGNFLLQSPLGTYYPPDAGASGRATAYQTTFAPSTTNPSTATVVTLQSGDQRTVDVQLTLVPTVTVSGSVVGPNGAVPMAVLRLVSSTSEFSDAPDYAAASALADASGAFTFLNVPAGSYVLRASKRGDANDRIGDSKLSGEAPLTVGETALDGVRVTLRKPLVVSGRVEFEGTTLPPADEMTRLKGDQPILILQGVGGSASGAPGIEDASGAFVTRPVTPGPYLVVSTIRSTRWSLKSAMWQGKDLTRTPIDLKEDAAGVVATFTDRAGRVSGTVRTGAVTPDKNAVVLLFPVDAKAWTAFGDFPRELLKTAAATTGTYAFSRIPSGDYFVVALVESPAVSSALDVPGTLRDWLNPAFLRAVSSAATRVRVSEGEVITQDLKTTVIR